MNKVILMGRLTSNPELRYSNGQNPLAVCRYTLAVDRNGKEKGTDFINCVCFGKAAEFVNSYFKKGLRVAVSGTLQTGSYINKKGDKVYKTDVLTNEHFFADGKTMAASETKQTAFEHSENKKMDETDTPYGFQTVMEEDDDLPF